MATKTIDKVFKFIDENKDILSTLSSFVPSQNNAAESASTRVSPIMPDPVSESIRELSSPANVSGSVESLSFFLRMKNIFIIVVVLWAITAIIARFTMEDETKKKDIEYVQNTLFGNIGVIPIILSVWIISVLMVSLVPVLVDTVPKLVGGVNSSLSDFIKILPALIK